MSIEQQLEECRLYIQTLAMMGYSQGSSPKEPEAFKLETRIQNRAWDTYIRIFGRKP